MNSYDHVEKMEQIRVRQEETLQELQTLLDKLEEQRGAYASLIEYYYSDQRNRDLEDDRAGLIPQTMNRGVLSEDAIFDLVGDYRDTAIRMMEVGLRMIKE